MINLAWYVKKIVGFEEVYTIAYRLRDGDNDNLLNKPCHFCAIKISDQYWYADPIIYEHDGNTYVFVELFSRKKQKGSIAVASINESGELSDFISVVEESFHLSFPFVFAMNEHIFMMPETLESGKFYFYEAVDFPYKWKRHTVIENNLNIVDPIIFTNENETFILASQLLETDRLRSCPLIFSLCLKNNMFAMAPENITSVDALYYSYESRNAGPIFSEQRKLYRPTQQSRKRQYGIGINFLQVTCAALHDYQEKNYLNATEIHERILIDGLGHKAIGFHTYGTTDKYEVIDVKFEVFNLSKWFSRIAASFRKLFFNME